MTLITQKQMSALTRLQQRLPQQPYELSYTLVTVFNEYKLLSITTRHKDTFLRVLAMVKRIVPNATCEIEHGTGWHYMDGTPYYHGSVNFILR